MRATPRQLSLLLATRSISKRKLLYPTRAGLESTVLERGSRVEKGAVSATPSPSCGLPASLQTDTQTNRVGKQSNSMAQTPRTSPVAAALAVALFLRLRRDAAQQVHAVLGLVLGAVERSTPHKAIVGPCDTPACTGEGDTDTAGCQHERSSASLSNFSKHPVESVPQQRKPFPDSVWGR